MNTNTLRSHHVRGGEGIPHSGIIREEVMSTGHRKERSCIAFWYYRIAGYQQQGRLLDCGRCDIASPDKTWLFVPA